MPRTKASSGPIKSLSQKTLVPRNDNAVPAASREELSAELIKAINAAQIERLRKILKRVCSENVASKSLVEREMLVPETEVVLYHADTASEEADSSWPSTETEEESEKSEEAADEESSKNEEDDEAVDPDLLNNNYLRILVERMQHEIEAKPGSKSATVVTSPEEWHKEAQLQLIRESIEAKEMTSGTQIAVCENCSKTFDPATTKSGDCVWHTADCTQPNKDAKVWTKHGAAVNKKSWKYEGFIKDPRYASGFSWTCCAANFNDTGCLKVKHKIRSGTLTSYTRSPRARPAPNLASKPVVTNRKKRKASEEIEEPTLRPRYAICEHCKEEFDVTSNFRGACDWHDGEKEFDSDSYIWDDMDEKWEVHNSLINDPHYEDGFVWTCCEKEGSAMGCKSTKHKATGMPRKKPHY